ncbi:MAG TPA: hypothetical protein V6C65_40895 [Allocoleopsis sp.]
MSLFSSFAKLENLWKTIAAVWPAVDAFVKQVESAFPAGSAGAAKLSAVKSYMEAAWGTVEGVVTDFESAWPTLQALVGALVATYNTIGLFTHKTSTGT